MTHFPGTNHWELTFLHEVNENIHSLNVIVLVRILIREKIMLPLNSQQVVCQHGDAHPTASELRLKATGQQSSSLLHPQAFPIAGERRELEKETGCSSLSRHTHNLQPQHSAASLAVVKARFSLF